MQKDSDGAWLFETAQLMNCPTYSFLSTLVVALLLAACSGENYDPGASAVSSKQGKPIQGKVIEGKLTANGKDSEPVSATQENNASIDSPESLFGQAQENNQSTDPAALVGQTLPSLAPQNSEGNASLNAAPVSNLPPLPEDSPYKEVAFRSISSFPYEVEWETDGKEPDPTAFLKRVPREIRNLSGTKVAVEGFMIPTMVNEDNKVTEFLLLPDQMSCCYGKSPAANGWVVVTSEGIDILMDQIIRVTGSMVVEERWDEEFFVGLYHLSCDNITGPAL